MLRDTSLFLAAVIALPALAAQPVSRRFKDCEAVCDNVHDCRVIGLTDNPPMTADGQAETLELDLWRKAGPEGEERLVLSQGGEFKPRGFKLDDKPAPELDRLPWKDRRQVRSWLPGDDSTRGLVIQWALEDRAAIRAFLDRIRDAKVLSVWGVIPELEHPRTPLAVSLAGLNAALLAVDDVQGRAGTKAAWIRRGDKPESAVPAAELPPKAPHPPRPPPLSKVEQRKILAAAQRRASAEDSVSAYALSADKALVIVEWGGNGGAGYNPSQGLEIVSRHHASVPEPFFLPQPEDAPGKPSQDPGELYRTEFDPDTLTLSTRYNGRGIGDCGGMRSWRFDGERFVLLAASSMDACAGLAPSDWPQEWVTRP
jgi:hypothetical protein